MIGEKKSESINYGSVVVQSTISMRLTKIFRSFFLSALFSFFPVLMIVKYLYSGSVFEYICVFGYLIVSAIAWLILTSLTPIFKFSNIPVPELPQNNDHLHIIASHTSFYTNTITLYISLTLFGTYLIIMWVNKKGKSLSDGVRVRSDEASVTNEKGLIKLIEKRVKDKKNNTEYTNWDFNFSENLKIPFMDWFTHFAVCGAARSGKSNFIKKLLSQARQKNMRAVIVDVDGDYLQEFYKEGDIILSLYDNRSLPWDFWHEPVPSNFFSDVLLCPDPDSNEFFDNAGEKLLASLIKISKSHEEFWRILCLDEVSLLKILDDNNDPIVKKYIGRAGSDQGIGAVASSLKNLDFIKYLNHNQRKKVSDSSQLNWFSFYEWVKKRDDSFVFILAKDNEWKESKPLIRAQVETFVSGMFERGESKNNIPTLLIMDELHKIGKLQIMEQLLSRGAKYYLTAITGYQNSAQMKSIFGKDEASSIFSGLQNLIAFKCTDPDLATEISDRLGKIEVETSEGSMAERNNSNNVSIRTRDKVNVSANQIMNLEKNCAWVKLAYYPPLYLTFDYVEYPKSLDKEGNIIPNTVSIRDEKSWTETIPLIPYYFGKKELMNLVDSYHNYSFYSDLEKKAIVAETFREIAFKVKENEYSFANIRYSYQATIDHVIISKEENDIVIYSYMIKRSKKKEEKKENNDKKLSPENDDPKNPENSSQISPIKISEDEYLSG